MTEFEREIVKAFNRFFEEADAVNGIAYRRKQHRFSSQFCDVLVDSADPSFYLAIENKSISAKSVNKLYFSQHFSDNELHQVDRISNFLDKSGRQGFLAVEIKRGRGKPRKAYMVPWENVAASFEAGETGIHIDDLDKYHPIERNSTEYSIPALFGEHAW